jgi:hypothetical protein
MEINRMLVGPASLAAIAAQFGGISVDSLARHRDNHLPNALLESRQAEQVAEADDLIGQTRNLLRHALDCLETMKHGGDQRGALLAVRSALECVTLLARLTGAFTERTELSGPGGGPIQVQQDTTATILAMLAQLREQRDDAAIEGELSPAALPAAATTPCTT